MTAEERESRAKFLEAVLLRVTVFVGVVGLCLTNYYAIEENQKLKAANQDLVQQVQELKERRPIIYTADNQGSVVLGRVTAKVQDSHGYTIDVEGYGKFLLDRATWEQINVGEIATQDILKGGADHGRTTASTKTQDPSRAERLRHRTPGRKLAALTEKGDIGNGRQKESTAPRPYPIDETATGRHAAYQESSQDRPSGQRPSNRQAV